MYFKKSLVSVLILIMICVLFVDGSDREARATGSNLLTNGGFESGTGTGWAYATTGGGAYTTAISTGVYSEGAQSLVLTAATTLGVTAYQYVDVTYPNEYVYSVSIKGDDVSSNSQVVVAIYGFNNSGYVRSMKVEQKATPHVWTKFSGRVVVPSDITILQLRIFVNETGSGKAYVDDVSMVVVEDNILTNGSFEQSADTGWSYWNQTSDPDYGISTAQYNDGIQSVGLAADNQAGLVAYQYAEVSPGEVYDYSFFLKGVDVDGGSQIVVSIYGFYNSFYVSELANQQDWTPTSWEEYAGTIVIPADVDEIQVRVFANYTGASGIVYLDQASVRLNTDNLLTNGSFEQGTGTGWAYTSPNPGYTTGISTTHVHEGKNSLELTAANNDGVRAYQYVDVQSGQEYELAVWAKGVGVSGSSQIVVAIYGFRNSGFIRELESVQDDTPGSWEQYTHRLVVPSDIDQLQFRVFVNETDTGAVYLDSAGVRLVAERNRLVNGDFEQGTTPGWTYATGSLTTPDVAVSTNEYYSGVQSLAMQVAVDDYVAATQDIAVQGGKEYVFSAMVHGVGVESTSITDITVYAISGVTYTVIGNVRGATPSIASIWHDKVRIPDNATQLEMRILVTDTDTGVLYVDDVNVQLLPDDPIRSLPLNGDMESGSGSSWTYTNIGRDALVKETDVTYYGGDKALVVNTPSLGIMSVSQRVEAESGKYYYFSFAVKGSAGILDANSVRLEIVGYDGDERIDIVDGTFTLSVVPEIEVVSDSAKTYWRKFRGYTVFPDHVDNVDLRLLISGGGGDIYLDEVEFTAAGTNTKTESTIYTDAIRNTIDNNITNHEWAQNIRDDVIDRLSDYDIFTDQQWFELIVDTTLPKSPYTVFESNGSFAGESSPPEPNESETGPAHAIAHLWEVDYVNHPFKIKDPNTDEWWPKNDFKAYYESGKKDGNGNYDPAAVFDPNEADSALLYNTDHPNPNDPLHMYGVDDGLGWEAPDGKTYRFIAYYNFKLFGDLVNVFNKGKIFADLRDAYLYTGDTDYADRAALMLSRIADLYPDTDYSSWYRIGYDTNGFTGKILGSIWEGLFTVPQVVKMYDAIFDRLDDQNLLDKLENIYGYAVTGSQVKEKINNRFIREAIRSVYNGHIVGNEGIKQYSNVILGIALGDSDEKDDILNWLLEPGDRTVDGGHLADIIYSSSSRDGFNGEVSMGYMLSALPTLQDIALLVENDPTGTYSILDDFPRFKETYGAFYKLFIDKTFLPNIGDSYPSAANVGEWAPIVSKAPGYLVDAFQLTGNEELAQMAYYYNGNTTDGLHGSIEYHQDSTIEDIDDIISLSGGYAGVDSQNLNGYGLALLREDDKHATTVYFGRNFLYDTSVDHLQYGAEAVGQVRGHAHRDKMSLSLYNYGLDLTAELGYPTSNDPSQNGIKFGWVSYVTSHNTVMVDAGGQLDSWSGRQRLFEDMGEVKVTEIEDDKVMPQTSLYRRTVAQVEVGADHFYTVDFFRVRGGTQHHYLFHGTGNQVTTSGLAMTPQNGGTYAGSEVEFGDYYDWKDEFDELLYGAPYYYQGSGFQFLENVGRDDSPSSTISVDWEIIDHVRPPLEQLDDVRLKLTMLDPPGEVALADGRVPLFGIVPANEYKYLIVKNESETAAESDFVSVLQPYRDTAFISSVAKATVSPNDGKTIAVKVTLTNGRVDYIISSTDPTTTYTIDSIISFKGEFGVYSETSGTRNFAKLVAGTELDVSASSTDLTLAGAYTTGTVADFTKTPEDTNYIYTTAVLPTDGSLIGRHIRIDSDMSDVRAYDAFYEIKNVDYDAVTSKYRISTGTMDFIARMKDPGDYSQGYIYNFEENDNFYITMVDSQ